MRDNLKSLGDAGEKTIGAFGLALSSLINVIGLAIKFVGDSIVNGGDLLESRVNDFNDRLTGEDEQTT